MEKDGFGNTQFSRVALVTGRPLYWDTRTADPGEHAERLGGLLKWCLSLPGVRLGIDPKGIGLILRSVYKQREEPLPEDVDGKLSLLGVTESGTVPWKGDIGHFDDHRERLLDLVRRTETSGDYVWIEPNEAQWWETGKWKNPEEAQWWVSKTIESLKEYAARADEDQGRLSHLFNRHRCTLFAPFDGSVLLGHLKERLDDEVYQRLPQDVRGSRDTIYWSWQLINFHFSRDRLVDIPLLALWSGRPAGTVWAPRRSRSERTTTLSQDQVPSLLEDILWKKFEVLFRAARKAFEISQAVPEFAGYTGHSSVFYFADLADPPALPEEYVGGRKPAIDPLLEKSLSPAPEGVAWGVLEERDLVVLRGEVAANDDFSRYSRYLLLPVDSGSASSQELEEKSEKNLARVASGLAYLEFTYDDEAESIYTDTESIRARQPLWGHILDNVEDSATISKDLLPGLGRVDHAQVYQEFRKLHILQRPRVKAKLDKELKDYQELVALAKAEDETKSYKGRTEEYLQRDRMTFSPLSDGNGTVLPNALLEPFPYKYLNKQLQTANEQAQLLENNVEKIKELSETASNVHQTTEQRARESLTARTTALSALVGFLALAGLAEFIPGAALGSEESASKPGWLPGSLLSGLETVVQHLIIIGLIAIPLGLLFYAVGWVSCKLPYRLNRFGNQAQRLWVYTGWAGAYCWVALLRQNFPMVDGKLFVGPLREFADSIHAIVQRPEKVARSTADEAWKKSEKMDKKATKLLCKLWKKTERARDGHTNPLVRFLDHYVWRFLKPPLRFSQFQWSSQPIGVTEWLRRTRYVRYRNELVVLCPKVVPSPRLSCILRYKSDDFLEGSMISDRGFRNSLNIVGFGEDEIESLKGWLEENAEQIREMDVKRFAKLLEERGVTAIPRDKPQGRIPDEWTGPLLR